MTDDTKLPPKPKPPAAGPKELASGTEGGLLSRWSARKHAVAQSEADTENAEVAAKLQNANRMETEARQSANRQAAEAIDIDIADYDTDFTPFLKDGVPAALRRRALQALWRTNPMLANVDGLNDYDEDFRVAEASFEVMKSSWEVGRGYAGKAREVTMEMEARDEDIRKTLAAEEKISGAEEDLKRSETVGADDTAEASSALETPQETIRAEEDDPAPGGMDARPKAIAAPEPEPPAAMSPARISLRHRLLRDRTQN